MLKVDLTTNRFEGGKELVFKTANDTFTVTNEYAPPGDFGHLKLFYSEINEMFFYGTIVWMGCGKILYPENWSPAEDFLHTNTKDYILPNGFDNVFTSYRDTLNYEIPWSGIQSLLKTREYMQANPTQKVKLFLYMPSVGVGDPADWKWIFFLKK
jgi:hypothetical protein